MHIILHVSYNDFNIKSYLLVLANLIPRSRSIICSLEVVKEKKSLLKLRPLPGILNYIPPFKDHNNRLIL